MTAVTPARGETLAPDRPPSPGTRHSIWRQAGHTLVHDRAAVVSLVIIGVLALLAIAAPLVAALTGHGPTDQFPSIGLSPAGLPRGPNHAFVLGTDNLGRDVLVRICYGARISLMVGVAASVSAVLIGTLVGLLSGFLGGMVDTALSRLTDLVLAFPSLLAAIALTSVLGSGVLIVIAVISVFSWGAVARIVRGQVLSVKEKEYVEAAYSVGETKWRIMSVEILPNVIGPILVITTLRVPTAIIIEASLSFLGLGVTPPQPTWGNMLAQSLNYYQVAWWLVLCPGIALLATTISFNMLGDSLRDALDPSGMIRAAGALRRKQT